MAEKQPILSRTAIQVHGIRIRERPQIVSGLIRSVGCQFQIGQKWHVVVQCECGTVKVCTVSNAGIAKSCGTCLPHSLFKHGLSNTRLHGIWRGMKNRCEAETCHNFKRYGGKGISVCGEWQEFISFHGWAIANGYADGLEIDRIDCDGDYEPSNCRWVEKHVNSALANWKHGRYAVTDVPISGDDSSSRQLTQEKRGKNWRTRKHVSEQLKPMID